ncbi:hypothetical protein J21TS3_48940 [Paenibacillus cookii]|uniref:Uncharacterized protein n=1 Tax=Paenibacillus cookii TaxID=157839 RepID=A0ABQ4M3P7_9BACL|nr:hypothetical protein J21TS3_48940 [Paenibacillus cookii]
MGPDPQLALLLQSEDGNRQMDPDAHPHPENRPPFVCELIELQAWGPSPRLLIARTIAAGMGAARRPAEIIKKAPSRVLSQR